MQEKELLMIPGPTPVPPPVLRACGKSMINHRGSEYEQLQASLEEDMKEIFQTKNDVIIFPSSGTGGMEASIVNLFSAGDRVLVVSIGEFGERFAEIAKAFGADVKKLDFEWGKAAEPGKIEQELKDDPEIKAVLVTHNETSTGVTNDLAAIYQVLLHYDVLYVVDAISSLAAIDLQTDNWGIDVAIGASQKALMVPPGLSLLTVSESAWQANAEARMPRFYWDWAQMKKYMARHQIPYTPAIPQLFGLRVALDWIKSVGLKNNFARHQRLAGALRAGIKAMGLELFADQNFASPTVTSIKVPEGIKPADLCRLMRTKYGVVIAGGQAHLRDKIVRVGHLGYVDDLDIIKTLTAMELALAELGYKLELGASIKAAQSLL